LLKLDLLNIGLLWQLGLERLKSFLFTLSNWLGVRISILISFGNLSESLDMSLVLLHEVVMHVSWKILVHVKPHALVIHILEKVVIIVAVIFLSVHWHSLNDYTVHNVCFFDVTDKVLP
jgi:hypothetical protein